MSLEDILSTLHNESRAPPPIRPCDTPNGSDTKTRWTAKELHRIIGCRRFRNYRHLLQTSKDGQWVDSGEFPHSIGTYTTIPKAKRGGQVDPTRFKYLDVVHMDIAFGDCVALGGARYALILVDRATCFDMLKALELSFRSMVRPRRTS